MKRVYIRWWWRRTHRGHLPSICPGGNSLRQTMWKGRKKVVVDVMLMVWGSGNARRNGDFYWRPRTLTNTEKRFKLPLTEAWFPVARAWLPICDCESYWRADAVSVSPRPVAAAPPLAPPPPRGFSYVKKKDKTNMSSWTSMQLSTKRTSIINRTNLFLIIVWIIVPFVIPVATGRFGRRRRGCGRRRGWCAHWYIAPGRLRSQVPVTTRWHWWI